MEILPLLEFAYNDSQHKATGYTPFVINHRRDPIVPAAMVVPAKTRNGSIGEYATQLEQDVQAIQRIVKEANHNAFVQAKQREDRKRGNPVFQCRR